MFRLTREVRFAIPADPPVGWTPRGSNGFAGKPPVDGLGHHFTLRATLGGATLGDAGYLRNIKDVDTALRERALPAVAEAIRSRMFGGGAGLLLDLTADLENAFPGHALTGLSLGLGPLTRLHVNPLEPTMVRLTQTFEFAAGHRLHMPSLSDDENRRLFGKCNNPNVHGHNYIFEVTIAGEPDEHGRIMAMTDLERIVDERVVEPFDHKNLNCEVAEFGDGMLNPSVENIAKVIYRRLKDDLPRLAEVTVWETPKTWCAYAE